ncbi:hypothetical protein LCGC14_1754030 [marine sediment metagenome]|uniref:Uncharacterized protein n=1 Tax=marine sediment metagenome TaxID=412755 RepID=A0A0F9JI65_9ZZZZ
MAVAAGTSPMSLPHSSNGRFDVMIVDFTSYRRMITSKKYSPDRRDNGLMPMSSMINRSGFRYCVSTLSWPANASSRRKSRTRSKIDRYRTVKPFLIAWRPSAWAR